jgi:DNA topoisomerase-1
MGEHILIITEKPNAAQRIAKALDEKGKPEKNDEDGVPFFVSHRDQKIVVVPALGHLYTLVQKKGGRKYYPVFNFEWAPRYLVERNAKETKPWVETISKLAEDAEEFVDACDYDIEGSLIGYCILKYACGNQESMAKRMKYSTLTKKELINAYETLMPNLDFSLIEAGKTRHEVDWLYGVNLTRALTLAENRWSGKYSTISTGRVQGPTLRFLATREKSILSFVPTPYWSIHAEAEIKGSIYEVEYEKKKIKKKMEADTVVTACKGKKGKIQEIQVRKYHRKPPIPFDLGALQRESYSLFSYSPMRTSGIAQRLYLEALISYPRTSSQKLPPAIDYKSILKSLGKKPKYKKLTSILLKKETLKPREGKKEDPAHPAIYPTGNLPERALSEAENRIWDLVTRRFMAVFGDPSLNQSMRVSLNISNHNFYLRGRQVLKKGWMQFYEPFIRSEEAFLPKIKEGQTVQLKQIFREDKFVNPPPRYNQSSLLKKMEDEEIGTKATRAGIIQTLYNRNYIRGKRIAVTVLGFDVINLLRKYCPEVISVKLTRELEQKMEQIQNNNEKRENILLEAVDQLKPLLDDFKKKEEVIGEELSKAIKRARKEARVVGDCPDCGTGELIILYSRKTRKRFIGCTNYFEGICTTSFPLPQKGTVKPTRSECSACHWPTVQVWIKGRRPWTLCFNPKCPKNIERAKRRKSS